MHKLTERHLQKMNYPQEGKTLFYLGILVRAGDEKKRSLGDKIYIRLHFEPNMKKLANEVIGVLMQYGLEEKLQWAIEGFYKNYHENTENISYDKKKFYLLAGAAFYSCTVNGIYSESLLGVKEVAEMLDQVGEEQWDSKKVSDYYRNKKTSRQFRKEFPDPDTFVGDRPAWLASTIEDFIKN